MSDTLTPEEAAKEAVIEYGERAREIFKNWEHLPATGWDDDNKLVEALRDLSEAVDAFRAIRQSKGVKPEEVEAMTQFRFPSGTDDRVYLLLKDLGQRRYFNEYGQLLYFAPSSRIIPIDPEDS